MVGKEEEKMRSLRNEFLLLCLCYVIMSLCCVVWYISTLCEQDGVSSIAFQTDYGNGQRRQGFLGSNQLYFLASSGHFAETEAGPVKEQVGRVRG